MGCEVIELERENIPENAKGIHIGLIPRAVSEAMDAAAEQEEETPDGL